MMLSTTSEHALRALVHMARLPKGQVVHGRDLAQASHIPPNYLAKILVALRNAGMLETSRGTGGGYRLSKASQEIYLIDVIELFETVGRGRAACFFGGTRECNPSAPCSAHVLWRNLRDAYLSFLISTPLSALAGLQDAGVPGGNDTGSSLPEVAKSETEIH